MSWYWDFVRKNVLNYKKSPCCGSRLVKLLPRTGMCAKCLDEEAAEKGICASSKIYVS